MLAYAEWKLIFSRGNVMSYHHLSYWDVLLAACLIFINGAVSFALKLGLGRPLLIASIRSCVQLGLIGFILKWVFALNNLLIILLIISLMTVIAALSAKGRFEIIYRGIFADTLLAILLPSWCILIIGMLIILRIEPWYSPQYLIPMAGMIIGNVLTGVALVTERLLSELKDKQGQIEMQLSLGASPWEAYQDIARIATRAGMLPTIHSMTVVGIVSLPGMMTGQILAGQDPEQAVRYQIIVLFFLASATALACIVVVYAIFKRAFSQLGVLRVEQFKVSQ